MKLFFHKKNSLIFVIVLLIVNEFKRYVKICDERLKVLKNLEKDIVKLHTNLIEKFNLLLDVYLFSIKDGGRDAIMV